jgi:enterochelin esterase family protein
MLKPVALVTLLCSTFAFAQTPKVQPVAIQSHEVNPDSTLTFRYAAPNATKVSLSIDASPKPLPMTRDDHGVWSVTTPVLPPEFYHYTFYEDGRPRTDPLNPAFVRNLLNPGSVALLPGSPAAPWELSAVPHGRVDHHIYTTHIAKNLPQNQESYVVYTPPGYDPQHKGGYPVLYLLHGWSDTEYAWTEEGHADAILDRLLADGKVVPMIVVMPLGYGDFDFVMHGFKAWREPASVSDNVDLYRKMLLTEIIPAVEHDYDTAPGRDNRAIAGLSMGGLESLTIGLSHTDQFAWVGGMSSAVFDANNAVFESYLPHLNATSADLRLLWIACGKTDGLITGNRQFIAWTKTRGFDPVAVETPGAHTWLTWRDNLVALAPLLFKTK